MNKKVLGLVPVMVTLLSITSCKGADSSEKKYTYRSAISATPTTWNPHEWETNDDSIVLGFTTAGLYEFCFNEARNGYVIKPEMADGEPVDVSEDSLTDDEVKRFGITPAAGEKEGTYKGYKWVVNLKPSACWENGEAINADTYVYSMEQILNPDMMNYRANSYYNGSVAIGNAKNYYNGGHAKYDYYTSSTPSVDGKQYFSFYQTIEQSKRRGGDTYATYSIYDWYNDETYKSKFEKYYSGQADERAKGLIKQQSGEWGTVSLPTFIEVNEQTKPLICLYLEEWSQAVVGSAFSEADLKYFTFKKTGEYERMEFSGKEKAVGIQKTGDYQITIYTSAKTTLFDFKYNFSSNWIVYKPLYEKYKTQIGSITKTKYGTNKDNYMSFGPYKLTSYVQDQGIHLVRNEKYCAFNAGEYQCTDIDLQVVPQQKTQLQLFLQGNLDDFGLEKEDMENYGKSSRLFYEPNTYTSKLTFNTSFDKLVKRQDAISKTTKYNKTIMTNPKFREAFFWALDRKSFCQTLTAGSSAAVVPLNSLYVADTSTGESYRSTKQGKSVIESLVGQNTNGYDVEKAKALFAEACEEENASTKPGHYEKGNNVVLEFKVYNSEDIYTKMMNFFKEALAAATKGTPLEGKIRIQKTVDPDYYDSMQAGDSDLIYTTWGGAQLNPYGVLECYCDPDRMFEYGFEPANEQLTLTINGEEKTKTYFEWSNALDGEGGEYSAANADKETRLQVLSGVELALCKQYRFVSIYARSSAYLLSYKIKTQGSDDYVPVMGYGGIRYYEFKYTDAEWEGVKDKFDYRS